MAIKHVTNADGKGWLIVRWENGSTVPAIPQYLRVEYLRNDGNREYFRVLEGPNAGRPASVRIRGPGRSYLADGDPQQPAGTVKFNRKTGKLIYGSTGPISATTLAGNPVPLGTHDLEMPDEVHILGRPYLTSSPFATTWFRIGHAGDRYLHPGRRSAGCVTVDALGRWTDIYNYLIRRRKGDSKSVGVIIVSE